MRSRGLSGRLPTPTKASAAFSVASQVFDEPLRHVGLRLLFLRNKKPPRKGGDFLLRRRWDSNPRGVAPKRFSRPPRYGHFATPPGMSLCRDEPRGHSE